MLSRPLVMGTVIEKPMSDPLTWAGRRKDTDYLESRPTLRG